MPSRELVTLGKYRTRLRTHVRSILKHCDETRGQWFLINSEMGAGKTHIVARELNKAGLRVLWFSSMHKNLEEIKSVIGSEDQVCHVYGLQHFIKGTNGACPHAKVVMEESKKGVLRSTVCRKCEKYKRQQCAYYEIIKSAPDKTVVLAPINYIHMEAYLAAWSQSRDVIIFDEDPTRQFFKKDSMKLSEIKQLRACFDRLRGSSVDTVRNFSWEMMYDLEDLISVFEKVRDLRRENEPVDPFNPLALLQDYFEPGSAGESSDQITAMREELYDSVKITLPELDSRRFFEKAIRPNLHGLDGLLHQLWHAARTGAEVGINTEERYFYYYTAPKLPTTATYFAMDFTGNGKRLELVLNRAKELASTSDFPTAVSAWGRENIGIDWLTNPGSRIIQVGESANAKSNLPMRKNRIRRVLMAIHKRHPRNHVAVISYKGWEKKQEFKALKEVFGKRMTYEHFFNLRGSNDLQDNSVFIIIGTPFLPFRNYCQIARDYYGDPLIPDVDAKTLARSGKNLNKNLQIVGEVFTTSEVVQAVGRSRYLNEKRWVYVLSNEEMQEYIAEIEVISEREFIKQSGTPMTSVQEDLLKAARKLLNNRRGFTIESLASEAGRSYEVTRRDMPYVVETLNLIEENRCGAEKGRPKKLFVKSK